MNILYKEDYETVADYKEAAKLQLKGQYTEKILKTYSIQKQINILLGVNATAGDKTALTAFLKGLDDKLISFEAAIDSKASKATIDSYTYKY